jgi:hypothetical protein
MLIVYSRLFESNGRHKYCQVVESTKISIDMDIETFKMRLKKDIRGIELYLEQHNSEDVAEMLWNEPARAMTSKEEELAFEDMLRRYTKEDLSQLLGISSCPVNLWQAELADVNVQGTAR